MTISRSRYKTYGQSKGFKNRANSLQISVDRIRQRNENKIKGVERLQKQEEERTKRTITGLNQNEATRAEIAQIHQNMELDIYRKKRDAIEVRASREVENLKGQAIEAGKQVSFWQDFSDTGVKNYTKLAQGLYGYLQYREGQDLINKADPEWFDLAGDQLIKQVKNIEEDGFQASLKRGADGKLLHPITKKEINASAGEWNGYYHNYEAQEFKKHRDSITSFLEQNARFKNGNTMLNPSLAPSVFASFAYNVLSVKDIPADSKAGRDIIRTATNWGRDLGIERQGAWQANQDSIKFKNRARALGTELRTFLGQQSGTTEQKITIEHLNTTFKTMHPMLEGSIFEINKGKYGLRKDWTQATLAEAIITEVFPYVKDLPYAELRSTINKMIAFNATTGKPIKEKGTTVGILDKVPDAEKVLKRLFNKEQKFQEESQKVELEKDRQAIIAPAEEAYNRCSLNKNDCGDWEAIKGDISRSIAQPLFDNSPLRATWQARTKYSKKSHGDLYKYENVLALVEKGDIEQALIFLVNRGTDIESGYLNDERFEGLRSSINAIKGAGGIPAIKESARLIYNKSKTPLSAILKDKGAKSTMDSKVMTALEHHILREIVKDSSDSTPQVKVSNARDKVEKEFLLGLDGKGYYAAIDAAKAHYTPAVIDSKTNKVIEAGGYGGKTKTSIKESDPTGFIFKTFDSRIDSGVTWNANDIKTTFLGDPLQEGETTTTSFSTAKLADNIARNLQDPDKSILTEDEKRDVMRIVLRGNTTDTDVISSNLKILSVYARAVDPNMTHKEVMDMVVTGLAQDPSGLYKGLNGKSYPMDLDDLTKKITGSCSKNQRNNFTKCIAEIAKQNNFKINNENPSLGSGDILQLLQILEMD